MPAIKPPSSAEWSLLRAACFENRAAATSIIKDLLTSSARQAIQWTTLVDIADGHGVLPLLSQALSGESQYVPSEALEKLRQSYQTNLHKALFLSRELISILNALTTAGIEVMPYKGLALAEAIYGDIALRQAGDIDLLVRPRDFARVRDVVREFGYVPHFNLSLQQEGAYLKSGYECAFDGPAGKNLLEVQWAIQPRFYAVDLEMESLFQHAITVNVAGRAIKSPCMEDLFLILAVHAAKHMWSRLIWICDLGRLSGLAFLNWKAIGSKAKDLGILRTLRVSLNLASNLTGTAIPSDTEKYLPNDPVSRTLASHIEKFLTTGVTFNPESLAYFRWMVRLRERRADRIKFINRLLLTPGPGEWALLRLPKALFPMYRVIRVGRLGARVVRNRL